jgi:hypothetical protein
MVLLVASRNPWFTENVIASRTLTLLPCFTRDKYIIIFFDGKRVDYVRGSPSKNGAKLLQNRAENRQFSKVR